MKAKKDTFTNAENLENIKSHCLFIVSLLNSFDTGNKQKNRIVKNVSRLLLFNVNLRNGLINLFVIEPH